MAGSDPWNLLALSPLPDHLLTELLGPLGETVRLITPASPDREGLLAALPKAELILGDWSGRFLLDAEAVARAGRLAFVQQPVVGVDGMDLRALADASVPLANAAGTNGIAVAEWCLAATLALLRDLLPADDAIRRGDWPALAPHTGELGGLRVGLVGFGEVGQRCARLFGALGSRVSYWSRRRHAPEEEHGAWYTELPDLLRDTDVVIVVIALTDETRGLLDRERLSMLPRGAFVVNASRGPVLDQQAVLALLDSGHLAGGALDVFHPEPPAPDDPVRDRPKTLLSPHVAGATRQTWQRVLRLVQDNLTAAITGCEVRNVVNGTTRKVTRRTAP